jgi:hypothetical protein
MDVASACFFYISKIFGRIWHLFKSVSDLGGMRFLSKASLGAKSFLLEPFLRKSESGCGCQSFVEPVSSLFFINDVAKIWCCGL